MFIFWAYFFVPIIINRPVGGATTMIAALVIYESAYLAEIIRSGIQALPSGQLEAGRSLGLSSTQTMRRIILPQALEIGRASWWERGGQYVVISVVAVSV